MQTLMTLTTVEQLQAMAHPIRLHVLRLLAGEPRTNKQLAARIGISPGRLHFHVRELERAGLIVLVEERPRGGVIEKYYQAAAENFTLGHQLGIPAAVDTTFVGATLEAARQEYTRAVNHVQQKSMVTAVQQGEARLSEAQVARIKTHLEAISDELKNANEEASDTHPYIFTGLFHTMAEQTDQDGAAVAG